MKCRLSVLFLFIWFRSFSQMQTCPVNINFASGDLTHWYAYTGNNSDGNGEGAIKERYDSSVSAPTGTRGAFFLTEYGLPSKAGIQVISSRTNDPFGGFPTIPTINGYNYNYSILLGSTAITRGSGANGTSAGGYIRGVSYGIHVPPGPATEPYTMTYAYAMVLENGTHVSSQQPYISVTLKTPAGIITCASPNYLLPTFGNVTQGGRGATLDSATAKRNGFKVSGVHSPNENPDPNGSGGEQYLQDVWTKGWTEVTYDLSPYRGQDVSLTFEADNCVPGGHFAYGYIAIRNNCAGLMISGDSLICNNTVVTYSVPTLDGATYDWTIPGDWTILSSDTSNIIQVKSTSNGGSVTVHEKNSCADLMDTIQIKTLPSPVGGTLEGSATVCAGENSSTLNLLNYSGVIRNWLSSSDGNTWTVIPNSTPKYTAENLGDSTFYRVEVGKGDVCPSDTSSPALVAVDQKSVGGLISPLESTLCLGQTAGEILTLSGNNGSVQNWQYSTDGSNWLDLQPADNTLSNTVKGITISTQYRLIDKNGICPADTSSTASILFNPVSFPQATSYPADTTICFGTSASLIASIQTGTSFTWEPVSIGNSNIGNTPFDLVNQVTPESTTEYILRVINEGCPNPLLDSFHVAVLAPVIVDAGRDTSVVAGEPLQFHAFSSDPGPDTFSWLPVIELNDPSISDPLATYTVEDNIIKYTVKATTAFGCTGVGFITVKVFKTKPDIFVPNAFTPGLAVNSLFRPIPVGISSLRYFRIYNRVGQLVYNTSAIGSGWDGMLNGSPQGAGGYVWMVQGTDYTGNVITKSGTMVLVR
jgi:PKD-like domain/CHU_C Type IX secretion signal domain